MKDIAINNIRNLSRQKNENEAIRDRVIRDIRNLFDDKEENCYKLLKSESHLPKKFPSFASLKSLLK